MECKVKIGCSYEPKWFERRYTQGTYSAKNIPADSETAWLQQAMLGRSFKRRNNFSWIGAVAILATLAIFLAAYL
jgi:hypothetical protein